MPHAEPYKGALLDFCLLKAEADGLLHDTPFMEDLRTHSKLLHRYLPTPSAPLAILDLPCTIPCPGAFSAAHVGNIVAAGLHRLLDSKGSVQKYLATSNACSSVGSRHVEDNGPFLSVAANLSISHKFNNRLFATSSWLISFTNCGHPKWGAFIVC